MPWWLDGEGVKTLAAPSSFYQLTHKQSYVLSRTTTEVYTLFSTPIRGRGILFGRERGAYHVRQPAYTARGGLDPHPQAGEEYN